MEAQGAHDCVEAVATLVVLARSTHGRQPAAAPPGERGVSGDTKFRWIAPPKAGEKGAVNKLDAARAERAWLQNHFGSEEAPDWGDGRKPSTEQFIACFERIIGPPKQRQSDVCDLTGISTTVMSREFIKYQKSPADYTKRSDGAPVVYMSGQARHLLRKDATDSAAHDGRMHTACMHACMHAFDASAC